MPKVFIPQIPHRVVKGPDNKPIFDDEGKILRKPVHDLTVARVYGDLQEPVFDALGVPPMTNSNVVRARHAMRNYNPDEDSIMAIGDPAGIALLTSAAVLDHRKYSILRWDGRMREYVKLDFDFNPK